jgi:signal transduction histidine kinase
VIATPARARSMGAALKYLLLAGFGLLLFVAVSNVLEHAGITAALDAYEDYAEVLLVPLVAYILYSRSTAEQLAAAEDAARAVQREHALLMSVVKTTPAGILMADDTGEVLFANDEARRIIELLPVGETSGDPGPILDLATVVASAPLDGSVYPVETDGDLMWVSVRATPLAVEDSEMRRAVVVLEDVTDRVTTARELDRYRTDLERLVDVRTGELLVVNRELQEANEIRQRFLANMSHELRTPLNSIIGFTDLLLRELPGPVTYEQRKQLGMVKESSAQLLGLVDDILDLARIEAGHSTVVRVTTDLVAHVHSVVESMSPIAEGKDVHLSFESDGPVALTTDPDKLGQIVRNLVSNALKFTDRDGSVTVSLRTLDGHVSLTVADTGIGIAPEDQQRIFEAFQQIDTPDRRKPHGTGLGLAICRELCDLLGYEISVESEPGVGSTFEIIIPRDEMAGPDAPGDGE